MRNAWSALATGVLVAAGAALLLAVAADRKAPPPTASMIEGSDAFFARGLEPREVENGKLARRWAGERLELEFLNLPDGPLRVTVEIAKHRGQVSLFANRRGLGSIPAGSSRAQFEVRPEGGRLELALATSPFEAAKGRRLGFQFQSVSVEHVPASGPPPLRLALGFLVLVLLVFASATLAGFSPAAATTLSVGVLVLHAARLLPKGAIRSPYGEEQALLVCGGALLCAAFARLVGRPVPATDGDASRWAFVSLMLAFLVQAVVAIRPNLVVSDLVFHSQRLQAVAAGNLFLTSLTPHEPAFRFPYGVAFYVPLVPFTWAGVDREDLVRYAAAAASLLASAALFRLLAPSGARRAGLAVALLQLLPVTVDLYTFGNFSNLFAQSLAFLFLCWWAGGARGGWPRGALLLGTAALAHLGVFIFLLLMAPALVLVERKEGGLDRSRILALAVGLGPALLYYGSFLELVTSQLPRLVQGSGAGGLSPSFLDRLSVQLVEARTEWGWPAMLLALASLGSGAGGVRSFRALWLAGLGAFALALVSPLEVRYLYALTPALAMAAADGVLRLARARGAAVVAVVLLAAQCAAALPGLVKQRYVPRASDRREPV